MTTAHLFWHGPLTQHQIGSMLSIQKAGFDVILWSFDKVELPTGIENRDASEIVDKSFLKKHTMSHYSDPNYSAEKSTLVLYSDVFRLTVLAKLGGWWFDCDVFCLKPVSWFNEAASTRSIVAGIEVHPHYANNAILSIPDKALANKLKGIVDSMLATRSTFNWGDIGPHLVTSFMKSEGIISQALPWTAFYAANYRYEGLWIEDPKEVALAEITCRTSAAIHWYNNQMYKLADGTLGIPPASYMGKLFATLPQDELTRWPSNIVKKEKAKTTKK